MHRKPQEIAGGFQGSRIKNTTAYSLEARKGGVRRGGGGVATACLKSAKLPLFSFSWEVLKGVGVDGAGGNLPFFLRFFAGISPFSSLFCAFLRFLGGNLPFSFAFSRFLPEQGANNCNLLEKTGNFTPTPLRTSRFSMPKKTAFEKRKRAAQVGMPSQTSVTPLSTFPTFQRTRERKRHINF